MALAVPGLQFHPTASTVESRTWTLNKETEYRFEADFDNTVDIKLISGSAEIFGTELTIGPVYSFTGYKGAVYTWEGCTLEVMGIRSSEYIAEETPMSVYANLHFGLEKLRCEENGPRVLLTGPDDSGKTSVAKILVGYAVRMGRKIDFINLDTREGVLSLPGTITAANFSTILDVEDGFGTASATGPSQIPAKVPLVYYYGQDSPTENPQYYKKLISRAALAVNAHHSEDKSSRQSGCIIDTAGCIDKKVGYDVIHNIVADFNVTHLVIVGHERLYSDMAGQFESQKSITVLKVPKSGGCVEREDSYIRKLQQRTVKYYFYGEPKRNLNAYSINLSLSSQTVFRLADAPVAHASALPIGHDFSHIDEVFVKVSTNMILQNSVLAVTHVDPEDAPGQLSEFSIMGFIYVSHVDVSKDLLTVLSPMPGKLPRKTLIMGSLKWQDS